MLNEPGAIIQYRIAGLVVSTDWPLLTAVPQTTANTPVDVTFRVVEQAPSVTAGSPIHYEDVGDFWMVSTNEWEFHLTHPEYGYQVELYLLGPFLSIWLEQREVTALHGSASTAGADSVGFLGPNGTGKSSLALAMVETGEKLITDDLLAVPIRDGVAWAEPTFPQSRLWPTEAKRRLGSIDGLALSHPNFDKLRIPLSGESFASEPRPLAALYLPRRGGSIAFNLETGATALFALMANSFAPWHSNQPENRPDWIARAAALLGSTALFVLSYPDDVEALPDVAAAVREHSASVIQSKLPPGTPDSNGA